MCIIVDANCAAELAATPPAPDGIPIHRWLFAGNGKIALGGRVTAELSRTPLRRMIIELMRSGRTHQYPNELVATEQARIGALGLCVSDDEHVIALASVSGCRLVFTRDRELQSDVKNRALLNRPRGKVYSSRRNSDLLERCPPCRAIAAEA